MFKPTLNHLKSSVCSFTQREVDNVLVSLKQRACQVQPLPLSPLPAASSGFR